MTVLCRSSLPLAEQGRIHPGMRRVRRGFGLLAVIMFVAIIATLLALSYPALMHFEQSSRVRQTWHLLETIRLATSQITPAPAATFPVFRQRVGTNPGRISQLFGPVDSGDAANYPDACGGSFLVIQRNNSRAWAPFIGSSFDPAVGLASPMGTISTNFLRVSISGSIYLMVVIPQADLSDIIMLDQYDDNDGATLGLVRWDTITGTTARLTYMIITDTAC